ncbi:MAG: flavin reductase family protein [Gemmatimonadota bacterium]|nr:MAG: flavin reductase family protein [Gemmatimonadota bacterium]
MLEGRNDTWESPIIRTEQISGRQRYQLLTSLVVPRPIGWISSFSKNGIANLAPFSYFAALADTPMLVGVSIGRRDGEPKDTLRNIRDTGAFCVNVVTEPQLVAMNESSGDYPPDVDEFEVAGLPMERASLVAAPYVGDCPAVLECRLFREVELGSAANRLILGEALAVRLRPELRRVPGTCHVDVESLKPVGRLFGDSYTLLRDIRSIPRPRIG